MSPRWRQHWNVYGLIWLSKYIVIIPSYEKCVYVSFKNQYLCDILNKYIYYKIHFNIGNTDIYYIFVKNAAEKYDYNYLI